MAQSDQNHCSNRLTSSYSWCQCWEHVSCAVLLYPQLRVLNFLIGLFSLAELYTCVAVGDEKVSGIDKIKDMPCWAHMAQFNTGFPCFPLLLPLLHLGVSVRDTVCQPIHACPACHVQVPAKNTLAFTETWVNPPILCTMHCRDRESIQGNMARANKVKC